MCNVNVTYCEMLSEAKSGHNEFMVSRELLSQPGEHSCRHCCITTARKGPDRQLDQSYILFVVYKRVCVGRE